MHFTRKENPNLPRIPAQFRISSLMVNIREFSENFPQKRPILSRIKSTFESLLVVHSKTIVAIFFN